MERLESMQLVIGERRVIQMALRVKLFCRCPQLLAPVHGILVDGNGSLSRGTMVSFILICRSKMSSMHTFSGTKSPQIKAPPCGTVLGRPPGVGGYRRSASSRQAFKYVRLPVAVNVISSSDVKASRTSSRSFFSASGFFRRKYVTPDSSVAVVSAPATTSRVLLASRPRMSIS